MENLSAVITLISQYVDSEWAGLPLVLEVCIYVLLVWSLGRRSPKHEDRMFSALNIHPYLVSYSGWYYVPMYLMEALIVPTRCYMIIYITKRLADEGVVGQKP